MSNDLSARLQKLEDRASIAELRARYCHLLDSREWPGFIDLFTEDGSFEGLQKVSGRQDLTRFFTELDVAEREWHFCTNGTIDLHGDTATGRISMEYISICKGISYVSAGHYDDVMVRQDGLWKFKSRKITFYFFSPMSEGFVGSPPTKVGRLLAARAGQEALAPTDSRS